MFTKEQNLCLVHLKARSGMPGYKNGARQAMLDRLHVLGFVRRSKTGLWFLTDAGQAYVGIEKIVGVAIKYPEPYGVMALAKPNRHHNVIQNFHELTGIVTRAEWTQGFWTSRQRFVDRTKSMLIAHQAKQVSDEKIKFNTYLYSEDLW